MSCEEVREMLPDFVLGTLSETEAASVRRHLRGCSACRAEAASLDEGVALFTGAAHAAEPPPELQDRVMAVLAEEWSEPSPVRKRPVRRLAIGWQAVAAVSIVLAGALTWASVAQGNASRFRADAASYRRFLGALGGRDVRVGSLVAAGGVTVQGNVLMYDSDKGQSWVLVLARAAGYDKPLTVRLVSATARTITVPFPLQFDSSGEAWTGMVTGADISSFDRVLLIDPEGRVVAQGQVPPGGD